MEIPREASVIIPACDEIKSLAVRLEIGASEETVTPIEVVTALSFSANLSASVADHNRTNFCFIELTTVFSKVVVFLSPLR